MKNVKASIIAILFAQLSLPLTFCFWGVWVVLFSPEISFEVLLQAVSTLGCFSLIGLFFSLPICLIVGFPIIQVLFYFDRLNLVNMLLLSWIAPVTVHFAVPGQGFIYVAIPVALLGSLLAWFYLHSKRLVTEDQRLMSTTVKQVI